MLYAKSKLAEAGVARGLDVVFSQRAGPPYDTIGQLLRQQLAELGISVKTLANWIRLARDGGIVKGGKRHPASDLEAEVSRLRAPRTRNFGWSGIS